MKNRGYFTIIELLIVTAIIAILAALMLPALNMARNKAKSTQCISNLKQLGVCFMHYTDDHDDYLPSGIDWPRLTGNYVYQDMDPLAARWSAADPWRKSIFYCPLDLHQPRCSKYGVNRYSHGMNVWLAVNYSASGYNKWPIRNRMIPHQTRHILVSDIDGDANPLNDTNGHYLLQTSTTYLYRDSRALMVAGNVALFKPQVMGQMGAKQLTWLPWNAKLEANPGSFN